MAATIKLKSIIFSIPAKTSLPLELKAMLIKNTILDSKAVMAKYSFNLKSTGNYQVIGTSEMYSRS